MVANPSEVGVTDVVKWLEKRKESGKKTILFLGARAGGLFRSKTLYSTAQYFSPRTFNNMTRVEQFGECCRVLHQKEFSKSDIDTILIASLQALEPSEADIRLSELVNGGFFDTIISTNIDDLLNKALARIQMKEARDFQIFLPQIDFIEDLQALQLTSPCLLLKIFGDLGKGEYSLIGNNFYLETYEKLKNFLISELQNDVLMLGYDPFWDRTIYPVFPQEGQEIWYVNEGMMEPALLPLLQKRNSKYILGGEGNYERFIQALHWHLISGKPASTTFSGEAITGESASSAPTSGERQNVGSRLPFFDTVQKSLPVLSTYEKEQRRRIFIVYSQKDKKHFKRFKTYLARYEREKLLDVWEDTKIAAGTKWHAEIKKTLDTTRVAILLISVDFLASSFIEENILPSLLQVAESGGAIILPVILGHCVFEDTALQQFQPFNLLSEPLATKNPGERDRVWADLVRYLITLAKDI
jgi:TIR domain